MKSIKILWRMVAAIAVAIGISQFFLIIILPSNSLRELDDFTNILALPFTFISNHGSKLLLPVPSD